MQKFLNMNWVFCLPSAVPTKNREKKEDRLAREQALDGHWPITEGKKSWATYPPVGEDRIKLHCKISRLQAAFSPVPDPSNYLSPLLPVSQCKKTVMACFTRKIFPQKRPTRSRMLPLTRQQAAATEVKMDPICLKWFQILPVEIKILLTTWFSSSGAKSISLSWKFKVGREKTGLYKWSCLASWTPGIFETWRNVQS